MGAGGLGSLASHRHTPTGRFGMNLGRWMNLGRDKAELDGLEGFWLGEGGVCLPQPSEGLRAGSDPFRAHLAD